jgi:hypothetical protein
MDKITVPDLTNDTNVVLPSFYQNKGEGVYFESRNRSSLGNMKGYRADNPVPVTTTVSPPLKSGIYQGQSLITQETPNGWNRKGAGAFWAPWFPPWFQYPNFD